MTEPRRTSRSRSTTVGSITAVGGGDGGDGGAEGRLGELEARLARLEGAPGLRQRGRGMVARVMPAEAGQHFRNAGREQLLGVRAIVDFWINRLDDLDARAREGSGHEQRETIEIE
jgi:hypothetical protein